MLKRSTKRPINQKEGFLGHVLGPLMKAGLPFKRIVLIFLAKNVMESIGLPAATSATDTAIQKKSHGPVMTALIIYIKYLIM